MGRNSDIKAIVCMSLFVAAFSMVSVGTLLVGGTEAQAKPVNSRLPSSVDKAVVKKVEHKEESLVFDCKKHLKKAFETSADRVQLKGLNCVKPTEGIVNSTNGYTASTFFPQAKLFLTDFIQLSEGSNRILLSAADGDHIEVIINRRAE